MYARVDRAEDIRIPLRYNELKVQHGVARCLEAVNFLKDAGELTMADKVFHFRRLLTLNDGTSKPVIHLSLNFHPSQVLSDQQLVKIAKEFMGKIGRGDQPYIVYRHEDVAHPHAHIVTITIQKDGSHHELTPKDLRLAKKVTQELEKKWSLVPSKPFHPGYTIPLGPPQKIVYGEMTLYRAMNNVIGNITVQYRYTTLDELNAVLRLYNVDAYAGKEGSKLKQYGGMMYRVLDENGQSRAGAIKASLFPGAPTLKNLEKKFALNESLREPHRMRVTTAIEWTLAGSALSPSAFREEMVKENISVVYRHDKEGRMQNVWFVDHGSRSVFEGAVLGARYSPEALSQKLIAEETRQEKVELQQSLRLHL
jgi:Relaxase/Mobilisation nuclease domain